mgnify:CR=1 FL=1
MSALSHLSLANERGVATLTLNRPERRNALSLGLMEETLACLDTLEADPDTRVIVIAAAGKVFSAGHDLSELVDADDEALRRIFDTCGRLMQRLSAMPQPVIAEVGGLATAAGCQLVAACDMAVASREASFATPGVRIGLFCTTPAVAISRAIGRKRALQMLLTGDAIDAATAADWGLVNAVVDAEVLRTEVKMLARRLAQASPFTLSVGKRAFYAQADVHQAGAYAYASEVMTMNATAEDAREGMRAFLEKRAPTWVGR